jgi:hypothetical protein
LRVDNRFGLKKPRCTVHGGACVSLHEGEWRWKGGEAEEAVEKMSWWWSREWSCRSKKQTNNTTKKEKTSSEEK